VGERWISAPPQPVFIIDLRDETVQKKDFSWNIWKGISRVYGTSAFIIKVGFLKER